MYIQFPCAPPFGTGAIIYLGYHALPKGLQLFLGRLWTRCNGGQLTTDYGPGSPCIMPASPTEDVLVVYLQLTE